MRDCVQDTHGDVDAARTIACLENTDVDIAEVSRCPDLLVTFCADTTANTGKNPFTRECADLTATEALTVEALNLARDNACLNFGTQANLSCSNRRIIQLSCLPANPYAHVGCNTAEESIITDADRRAYCLTNEGYYKSRLPECKFC